jgi:hypothetical protein
MTEFQQIESVVQRVVGRPLAALVYGVFFILLHFPRTSMFARNPD